jgi:predicted transcriptional regulator
MNLGDLISKRKHDIVRLLGEGSLTLSEIAEQLSLTPSTTLYHVSQLEKANILLRNGKKLRLTVKGEIFLNWLEQIRKTLEVISKDPEFWTNHDLSDIPEKLLLRLGDLEDYTVIRSGEAEVLKHKRLFVSIMANSRWIKAIFGFFLPDYPKLMAGLSKTRKISVIVTREIANTLIENYWGDVDEFEGELMVYGNAKLVCIVTSDALCLGLFDKYGNYDLRCGLVSHSENAIEWGLDLFEYFARRSLTIKLF